MKVTIRFTKPDEMSSGKLLILWQTIASIFLFCGIDDYEIEP